MAFSIEARTPFLDFRLAEYVSQLPASYRIHDGWTKFALRKALDPILPRAITWRTDKKGFATPEQKWVQALVPRAQSLLDSNARIAPYMNMQVVASTLKLHSAAADRATSASIWRWLMAELWLRMIEKPRGTS